MSQVHQASTLAAGLAMFSMFFGAGNVVFPLALGQIAQDQNVFAILGMLITAVGVPFLGLVAMTLFNGNYTHFFDRLGWIPGFLAIVFIMGLIGPFGAIPRCIALSYSTAKVFLSDVSLPLFSFISCLVIYLFTFKRTTIVDTLGYFLTPILLGSLGYIIIKGLINPPPLTESSYGSFSIFLKGLRDGYQTMDLLGAFFFSSLVIACLKGDINTDNLSKQEAKSLLFKTLKASAIGAVLLALTYIGFSYVAAFYGPHLKDVPPDELISAIAVHVMGEKAALVACVAVAAACLTTAIALTTVFAEFIHSDISARNIEYRASLIVTLVITYFISTLHFDGIAAFLTPILQICYPALIVLSALNILFKLQHFKPVKLPVFFVFGVSVFWYFLIR